jgi:hypothetical protein
MSGNEYVEIIEISSDESEEPERATRLTTKEEYNQIRAITWGLLSERAKKSILRLRLTSYVASPGSPNAPLAQPPPTQPEPKQPPPTQPPAESSGEASEKSSEQLCEDGARPSHIKTLLPAKKAHSPNQAAQQTLINSEEEAVVSERRDRRYLPPNEEDRRRAAICRARILRATGSDESDSTVGENPGPTLTAPSRVGKTAKALSKRPQRARKVLHERQPREIMWVPPRQFRPARWPPRIASLRDQFNPLDIEWAYETPFFSSCDCDSPCRHHTCVNGKMGVFCAPHCCSYGGKCGNALRTIKCLRLVRRVGTPDLAVLATDVIEQGMVIGQYLGEIWVGDCGDENSSACDGEESELQPPVNKEYRYEVQRKPIDHESRKVFIDAFRFGSITRFMNHSCDPAARFHEVRNRSVHTVVVVAARMIQPGEEVTVHYGTKLWFRCECGQKNCVDKPKAGKYYL